MSCNHAALWVVDVVCVVRCLHGEMRVCMRVFMSVRCADSVLLCFPGAAVCCGVLPSDAKKAGVTGTAAKAIKREKITVDESLKILNLDRSQMHRSTVEDVRLMLLWFVFVLWILQPLTMS